MESVNKKFSKIKKNLFEDFIEIKTHSNSPQNIIDSSSSIPFVEHDPKSKSVVSKNDLLDFYIYYRKINDDIWILVSKILFKQNVKTINIYDKSNPVQFNFINLYCKDENVPSNCLINGEKSKTGVWSIQKAGGVKEVFHFKGSSEQNITLYFTDEGIKKYLPKNADEISRFFEEFSIANKKKLLFNDATNDSELTFARYLNLLKEEYFNKENDQKLVDSIGQFFRLFLAEFDVSAINKSRLQISEKDYNTINLVIEILNENALIGFPGIENIASQVGVSVTKLKSDFKKIQNQGIYRYFSLIQMQMAKKMLENQMKVSEVSKILGYKSVSKFSSKFYREYKLLPSKV